MEELPGTEAVPDEGFDGVQVFRTLSLAATRDGGDLGVAAALPEEAVGRGDTSGLPGGEPRVLNLDHDVRDGRKGLCLVRLVWEGNGVECLADEDLHSGQEGTAKRGNAVFVPGVVPPGRLREDKDAAFVTRCMLALKNFT